MTLLEEFDCITAENEPDSCVCAFRVTGNKCAYHGRREMQREALAQHEAGEISDALFTLKVEYLLDNKWPSRQEFDALEGVE